jgi:CubicO group peptidase (beta-lactamase class C family)
MDFTKLKYFMDHLTTWRIPGNSVCVMLHNKEVFRYSSGYDDFENKRPMTGNELFNIYSCSKVATVTAALQLFEKGEFLLDTPLYCFIPEFKDVYVKGEHSDKVKANSPITMRHLFTMTAGFDYNMQSPAFQKARTLTDGKMNTTVVARCIAEQDLCFQPGTRWQYSLCHDVLGAVVEIISGKRFSKYMKENVFEPIGIKDAWYHYASGLSEKMACQYRYEPHDSSIAFDAVEAQIHSPNKEGLLKNVGKQKNMTVGVGFDSGGGGIITSVGEYVKLANALANSGLAANGERILSEGTVKLLITNQLSNELLKHFNWSQLAGYGYGLGVRTMIDTARGGSNGNIGEFGWGGAAGATLLADTKIGLAVFYAHHMLNPQEDYYQPRLRNVIYACL